MDHSQARRANQSKKLGKKPVVSDSSATDSDSSSEMSHETPVQIIQPKGTKRPRQSSSEEGSYWDEDIEEDAQGKNIKEIPVEFDVRVMEEIDFKTIRNFLSLYCQNKTFDASELTEIILNQEYLGSVIRETSESESFGFISVVNINYHKEKLCIKQIKDFILSKAPAHEKQKWQLALSLETVGLLLNERLINVPSALAPNLHETIYEEIDWALEDGHPFNFDSFIYITSWIHPDSGKTKPNSTERTKKKPKVNRQWIKPEDQVYLEKASFYIEFPVNHSETRVVMLFKSNVVPSLLNDIKVTILEEYCW